MLTWSLDCFGYGQLEPCLPRCTDQRTASNLSDVCGRFPIEFDPRSKAPRLGKEFNPTLLISNLEALKDDSSAFAEFSH